MNWGTKIIAVYIIFVAGILTLVVLSSKQNQDLVTTDYYEQELKYQQKIDQVKRSDALSAPLELTQNRQFIRITFPKEMEHEAINADVLLYSPADKTRDVARTFYATSGQLEFPLHSGMKGMYIVKVNWVAKGASYYYERKIVLS